MPKKRSCVMPPTTCFLAALNAGSDGLDALSKNSALANHLLSLLKVFARKAAQEEFEVFIKGTLETDGVEQTSEGSEKAQPKERAKAERGRLSSAPDDRLLSVREAAARLKVSEKTIRRKIESGDLSARRFGKLLRICERDLFPPTSGRSV